MSCRPIGRGVLRVHLSVLAFVVNEKEEILLLAHPKREGGWEVVNGALEAGETVLEGALRETK